MIDKIKKNYFLIIGTFLFLYFFFNLLDGERGLISLLKKENLLNKLKLEEKQLKMIISKLEFKNDLLSKNLDKDYIEILLREKFIYSKKGEKIYVLKNNEKSN
tara:strand:- start:2790 stop:3098 length:309 start_codon:yes stop_codon:yes gene_type:complete